MLMGRKNFVITAMGRSGTKLLADLMDRSPSWTVRHEPRLSKSYLGFGEPTGLRPHKLERLQKRFDRDRYGEVNSYLRHVIGLLDVAKKGVIVRNPRRIALSMYNRKASLVEKGKLTYEGLAEHLGLALRSLDYAIEHLGVLKISFERMVSDVEYVNRIVREVGVDDLVLTSGDLARPVNANRLVLCKHFADTDETFQACVIQETDWFMTKYYT